MAKCMKVRYRDRIGALFALANAQWVDSPTRPKIESRAYKCPKCAGYHLTSAQQHAQGKRSKKYG